MIVYHGTDNLSAESILANGIKLKYGDKSVDNGQGFYTTPNLQFAAERAKETAYRKSMLTEQALYPVVIEIDLQIPINDSDITIKSFDEGCTYEWKEFIFYNRIGRRALQKWEIKSNNHNLDAKYDIVINETADTGVNRTVANYRYKKNVNVHDLQEIINTINKSSRPYWDKQISLHTKKACSFIKSMKIISLKDE